MCYAFYFTTTANDTVLFFNEIWRHMRLYFIMFLVNLFLLALSYRFITLFIWVYILCKKFIYGVYILMLQMFSSRYIYIYIYFSFTQLNKRRIFLLRRLEWLSSFHIRENVSELFFASKKKKVNFLNSFVSKKIHIWYFLPVSKVMNKIFRFCHFWCTFCFFINKNAKIKT